MLAENSRKAQVGFKCNHLLAQRLPNLSTSLYLGSAAKCRSLCFPCCVNRQLVREESNEKKTAAAAIAILPNKWHERLTHRTEAITYVDIYIFPSGKVRTLLGCCYVIDVGAKSKIPDSKIGFSSFAIREQVIAMQSGKKDFSCLESFRLSLLSPSSLPCKHLNLKAIKMARISRGVPNQQKRFA